MEINHLINELSEKLTPVCSSQHEAKQQAMWLLEKITKTSEAELISLSEIVLTADQEKELSEFIKSRIEDEKPLQYILGYVPFMNVNIKVKAPILIPRPETEEMVAWLIEKIKITKKPDNLKILDVGTGTGCIALSIAKAFPKIEVWGVDINKECIELAKINQKNNNIKNANFVVSDFYSELNPKIKYDIIVSNPPYITEEEWVTLDHTVKKWENKTALVAEKKGLYAFNKIASGAAKFLKKNDDPQIPSILFEFGKGQEKALKKILISNGFTKIEIFTDIQGIKRWMSATL